MPKAGAMSMKQFKHLKKNCWDGCDCSLCKSYREHCGSNTEEQKNV